MPVASLGKARDRAILARREQRIHEGGAEIELEDLRAVEPVLAVVAAEDHPRVVPLAYRVEAFGGIRRHEIVERAGAVRGELPVLVTVVVQYLVLETQGRVIRRLGHRELL